MKKVVVGLFLFVFAISFVAAAASSSIRTDFYIEDEGMTGGYEEDSVATDSDGSSEMIGKVMYWAVILIVLAVLIKIVLVILRKPHTAPRVSSVKKVVRSKVVSSRARKTKVKKARRKK